MYHVIREWWMTVEWTNKKWKKNNKKTNKKHHVRPNLPRAIRVQTTGQQFLQMFPNLSKLSLFKNNWIQPEMHSYDEYKRAYSISTVILV